MAPENGTILNLLANAPWQGNARLHGFFIQPEQFTAIFSSANSAFSAVKKFLWGIRRYPVFLRCTPDRVSTTFFEPIRFAVACNEGHCSLTIE
jgi:hypothetical protein